MRLPDLPRGPRGREPPTGTLHHRQAKTKKKKHKAESARTDAAAASGTNICDEFADDDPLMEPLCEILGQPSTSAEYASPAQLDQRLYDLMQQWNLHPPLEY